MNTIDAMKQAKAALQDLIGEHYGDRESVVSNFGRRAVSDLNEAIARAAAAQPPQAERVPMTDAEIAAISEAYWLYPRKFVRAIEAHHKIGVK